MEATSCAVFSPDLGAGDLRVTARARERLRAIFASCDDPRVESVRVFLSGQGCAGMRYVMTFGGARQPHDYVLACGAFDILVDAIAFAYLHGAEIDLEQREGAEDAFVFNGAFQATGGSGLCGGCGAAAAG